MLDLKTSIKSKRTVIIYFIKLCVLRKDGLVGQGKSFLLDVAKLVEL